MLENIIYESLPILSLIDLKDEIQKAFLVVNRSKRRNIIYLYETFRCRFVKVSKNNRNQINKWLVSVFFLTGLKKDEHHKKQFFK